ncbi:MAG: trypsin-like peptidase domain-containing protein [Clostridia bacterium]|nr:trypsin-like peptidase domain-containing protein [Clostridia bacterium]
MKRRSANKTLVWALSILTALALVLTTANVVGALNKSAIAEAAMYAEPVADTSPAIYVAWKNANSVVGVITNKQDWNRSTGEVEETMYSQGSGVVIAEGGYVLTNNHVIEGGDSYKVLLSNGEKVDAVLTGADSSMDLAVLQVTGSAADDLVPASIGSSANLIVGGTAIAIGNPSGEELANTVTQGIISSLERSSVYSDNTTRHVDYIQHDAAINAGNSGGGLFNYKGELIGINTLKYSGSAYSGASIEGLGFAIPIDSAYPIALQLIENGEVIRPQMGISVGDFEGPDEPMGNYPPASICVYEINEGSSAEEAGMQPYDFIYAVNGERVKTFRELTGILDRFKAGDTVEITVVRYGHVGPASNYNSYSPYEDFFGNFGFGFGFNYGNSNNNQSSSGITVGGGYEFIDLEVELELPEEE